MQADVARTQKTRAAARVMYSGGCFSGLFNVVAIGLKSPRCLTYKIRTSRRMSSLKCRRDTVLHGCPDTLKDSACRGKSLYKGLFATENPETAIFQALNRVLDPQESDNLPQHGGAVAVLDSLDATKTGAARRLMITRQRAAPVVVGAARSTPRAAPNFAAPRTQCDQARHPGRTSASATRSRTRPVADRRLSDRQR